MGHVIIVGACLVLASFVLFTAVPWMVRRTIEMRAEDEDT